MFQYTQCAKDVYTCIELKNLPVSGFLHGVVQIAVVQHSFMHLYNKRQIRAGGSVKLLVRQSYQNNFVMVNFHG